MNNTDTNITIIIESSVWGLRSGVQGLQESRV